MIYIFTAFYWEAQGLIEQYHLKKVLESTHFQQFTDEAAKILLTVSGTGEIAAAAAVSSVCTRYPPRKEDFLLNLGICAGDAEKGSIFLIHKLTEQATGKTFYPDLLYRHGFLEAELVPCMVPWKHRPDQETWLGRPDQETGPGRPDQETWPGRPDQETWPGRPDQETGPGRPDGHAGYGLCVFDMEGAAVYQAGACYFAPHQMLFLKLVSDSGEGVRLSGTFIRQLMEMQMESITAFLERLLRVFGQQPGEQEPGGKTQLEMDCGAESGRSWKRELEAGLESEQMQQWIKGLCADLHASKTMGDQIRQLVRYAVLTGADCRAAVERMYQERRLPCRDKREGKQRFEELKRQLL